MPEAPPADPLESRMRDPLFAKAYETWLEIVVERAERARPRDRRIVLPDRPDLSGLERPDSLAG